MALGRLHSPCRAKDLVLAVRALGISILYALFHTIQPAAQPDRLSSCGKHRVTRRLSFRMRASTEVAVPPIVFSKGTMGCGSLCFERYRHLRCAFVYCSSGT